MDIFITEDYKLTIIETLPSMQFGGRCVLVQAKLIRSGGTIILASGLDPDDDDDDSDNPGDVNPPPPLAMNDNVFHSLGVMAMNWRMEYIVAERAPNLCPYVCTVLYSGVSEKGPHSIVIDLSLCTEYFVHILPPQEGRHFALLCVKLRKRGSRIMTRINSRV